MYELKLTRESSLYEDNGQNYDVVAVNGHKTVFKITDRLFFLSCISKILECAKKENKRRITFLILLFCKQSRLVDKRELLLTQLAVIFCLTILWTCSQMIQILLYRTNIYCRHLWLLIRSTSRLCLSIGDPRDI